MGKEAQKKIVNNNKLRLEFYIAIIKGNLEWIIEFYTGGKG